LLTLRRPPTPTPFPYTTLFRSGYVLGPHDPTHRFTYWVERVAEGRSPMAGPNADQPLQGVDARDLGAFTVAQLDKQVVDTFHVRSEEHTSELQSRGHLVCRLLL